MTGNVLEEIAQLDVDEICIRCGVTVATIEAYVAEGLIEVQGEDVTLWRFSEVTLVHIQRAYRMERDLRLNPAGVVLAVELIEQIERLKIQLRRLEQ